MGAVPAAADTDDHVAGAARTHPTAPVRRFPAEWEPRGGTLLAWPSAEQAWRGQYAGVLAAFRELVAELREVEPVCVLVSPEEREDAGALLGGEDGISLRLEPLPVNDIWMRDAGPLWVREGSRTLLVDGGFNGWGNKHPCELDALVPLMLARRWGQRRERLPLTLEGGALESSGAGDLLTTESVLGAPARDNPDMPEMERALRTTLGVRRVHWLPRGLSGDDTDGHIDNLARFVAPDRIVAMRSADGAHPDAAMLEDMHRRLSALDLVTGPPEVVSLPAPVLQGPDDEWLPASYANFYIAPGRVIVPQFGVPQDAIALGVLADCLPDHRPVGLDARALVHLGGTFHCMAQPLGVFPDGAQDAHGS